MNRTICFLFATCLALSTYAQTTLPTSWSFVGSPPTGWTASGMAFYTGSGNTPPAGKFDNTGDYLEIWFVDAPGTVEYYLTGNSFSGGTFTVEESINGTVWTALHTHTSPPAGNYVMYTDVPNINTRHIRFFYTTKVTGNIGVDDINITLAPAGPAQEINVKYNSTGYANGSTVYFSSPVSTLASQTFSIENLGTVNTLNIVSATITGPASADYTVNTAPSAVAPSSASNLVIDFTPSASGTRYATLTIVNDDSDENPYIIYLYGIGGTLASEPTAQPTGMTFSNVKSYRMTVNYTAASPAPDAGYIVLRKKGSAITDAPADGMTYVRGDQVGASKVLYVGTGTSVTPNNIVAGSDYYFAVFAYNGGGVYTNYMQATPLTGMQTSLSNMIGSYYSGVNSGQASFVTNLHNLINPHTFTYYSNYGPTNIKLFAQRDTTGNKRAVTCVYTGFVDVFDEPFLWDTLSREHTFAHSWMPTYPADNPEKPEYNDQHHLFPVEFLNSNQVRSNKPLGEVVTVQQQFMGGKYGLDINGNAVYEPRDAHKGDAARAMFYMCTSYHTVSGNNWFLPSQQSQDILKKWHWQDPPSAWEIARNDFLDSLQGNRNPFIDSVDWVCYIDFYTMTKITSPTLPCIPNGIEQHNLELAYFYVYPNPNNGIFTLNSFFSGNDNITVRVTDMQGKVLLEKKQVVSRGEWKQEINLSSCGKGIYAIELITAHGQSSQRVIIE